MSQQRLFTVEEANALLPTVAPMVESLRDAQREMDDRHDQVTSVAAGNGGGEPGTAFLEANERAAAMLAEIQALGIVVRDPSTGLIDFPAERDGEEIFLCWRLGEDDVAWWHPIDTGIAGRQPL
ncbi:MAG TPA: DUF2203 domain-containing protein [Actinomycetota bacterium]|nr:DUF2203 domain-containing protein [Actinomycetota bacterium]